MAEFKHKSVLLDECIDALNLKADGLYIDGTLGGGGHSSEMLKRMPTCHLLGLDRDDEALSAAGARLAQYDGNFKSFKSNYADFDLVLNDLGIDKFDGLLLDLGVSSYQLDNSERGFSYMQDAPLDMRMDRSAELSAYEVVNTYSESELHRIIKEYGEERWAKRIAEFIVKARNEKSIKTTFELLDIIEKAIPKAVRQKAGHTGKRTFQAIRIAVNDELQIIESTIDKAVERLNSGGRIVIISFHSLEDRIVKHAFKKHTLHCICPPELPICQCEQVQKLKILSKKPILPSVSEIATNPRARSAKLRVAERV